MTTFVRGPVDESPLAPLGRRVMVRPVDTDVSMVDVDGVDPAMVADLLRRNGSDVLDEAPVPETVPETEPAPEPVDVDEPPAPPPPPPAMPDWWITDAHRAKKLIDARLGVGGIAPVDLSGVEAALEALATEVRSYRHCDAVAATVDLAPVLDAMAARDVPEHHHPEHRHDDLRAPVDLTPVMSTLDRLSAELEQLPRRADLPAVAVAELSRWRRSAPWLPAAVVLVGELVAHLH